MDDSSWINWLIYKLGAVLTTGVLGAIIYYVLLSKYIASEQFLLWWAIVTLLVAIFYKSKDEKEEDKYIRVVAKTIQVKEEK